MRIALAAAVCVTTAAHASVLRETVAMVPGALIVSVTVAPGAGFETVLLPLPAPAVATAADATALDALLAATAPRLVARFDADPCFAHPATPPPPQALALAALPGTPIPVAFATFAARGPALGAWLHAHGGALATPPLRPVLVLVVPRGATTAPIRLDFAQPLTGVPLSAAASATVLLVGDGPRALQGIPTAPAPGGAALPEFVYGQFGSAFLAMLHTADTPAVVDYAGLLPRGGFAMRIELRNPRVGVLPVTPAPGTPRIETIFNTRIGWKGEYTLACTQGFAYRRELTTRWQAENTTLAKITGWQNSDIRRAMVGGWERSVHEQETK